MNFDRVRAHGQRAGDLLVARPSRKQAHDLELALGEGFARFCAEPTCPTAQTRLALPTMGCATELEARTGCNMPEFVFTSPTRTQFLSCRLPLVRDDTQRSAHPSCEYVDETIRNCPDLLVFLGGTP